MVGEQVSALLVRARLALVLARPPLVLLLALSGALGAASAGAALDVVPVLRALMVLLPFLVLCVALNDLADVAVDRVNLPGDRSRPLASGLAREREVRITAALAAVLCAVAAASVGRVGLAVAVGGMLLAAAYSLPPFSLSRRGVVAPLVLPLGVLAVPFVVGVEAAGSTMGRDQLLLLGAVYLGFIGRLLLKDFRDVRGDALMGKRTFLVRHGRASTCLLSGLMWLAGSVALLAVPQPSPALVVCWSVTLGTALVLLAALARSSHPHHDERLISALAQSGRALVLLLLLHLGLVQQGADPMRAGGLLALVAAALIASSIDLAVNGPSHGAWLSARSLRAAPRQRPRGTDPRPASVTSSPLRARSR
jgi:4-hydroxybenzoate polyprenyltransferase